MLKHFFLRLVVPVLLIVFVFRYIIYRNTTEDFNYTWDYSVENTSGVSNDFYAEDGMHRGMSVYNLWRNTDRTLNDLQKSNVEWISLFPYLSQGDETSTQVNLRDNYDTFNERDSLLIQSINEAHSRGFKIMLKPHLWLTEGWRANITLSSENEWNNWFASYKKVILHYAKIAAKTDIELLCIGTELRSSIEYQPKAWGQLIDDIKEVYSGKLTYAANWDGEFENVSFWDKLDYIGVQAYFPLTTEKNPDIDAIKKGWETPMATLEDISNTYNKPILFTEVGYRNDAYATVEPWEWSSFLSVLYKKKSDKTQYLAYKALFTELWHQEWFAGLYAWQWNSGDFPIRNRPSANEITKWYGQPIDIKMEELETKVPTLHPKKN